MRIFFVLFSINIYLYCNTLENKYYEINDTSTMKKEFFSFMKKLSDIENKKILEERDYIIKHYDNQDTIFNNIKKRYSIDDNASLREYLYVIDAIPTSLVLSQSAIESAWGKSRFFKKAKNIFGQWTWTGYGLDPLQRDENKKHKIKIFSSYQASVRGYMINLNKGWGYKDFRNLRQMLRDKKQQLSGYVLAPGLIKYSQKREEYIKILKFFIRYNELYVYDIY